MRVLAIAFLALIVMGCQPKCSTKTCPLNVTRDSYLLQYKICQDGLNYPEFVLPVQYTASCSVCKDKPSAGASLRVSYPDFCPAKDKSEKKLQNGELSIRINSNCNGYFDFDYKDDEKERSEKLSKLINRNVNSKGRNGKLRYAPIKDLGNGVYFQEFIHERKDGYHQYFYKNESDVIESKFWCGNDNDCATEENKLIADGGYSFVYRFKGIEPRNYSKLGKEVEKFLSDLYQGIEPSCEGNSIPNFLQARKYND